MARDYKNLKVSFGDPAIGKRVRILNNTRYDGQHVGMDGTVRAFWSSNSVAVEIDGLRHDTNRHGYFYFGMDELTFINEDIKNKKEGEEKTMNKIDNYLNIAEVQFLNTNDPFRNIECANYEGGLKAGDVCVVKTARHGMALAEVIDIKDAPQDGEVLREIVSIVDTTRYDERVAKREKAAELKAKMKERAKQLQDIALFQMLAKDDPEMAQLLEEFQGVSTAKEG